MIQGHPQAGGFFYAISKPIAILYYFCRMLKSYEETINFLYAQLPVFHHIGPAAYKKDLTNTLSLCSFLNNPHQKFKTVHVAGTNGKGSSSHMLAAVLQSAGYKTGLYTSPHLKDFTERIRINGAGIDKGFVVDFVNRMMGTLDEIKPSFFELTVAMAFEYYAREKVDIAVIETGLGGRLDSTNVITPEVSLITNIGYDHMDILGDTLQKIASEKAGIIKPNVPIVVSERQPEVEQIFIDKALSGNSEIHFASDEVKVVLEAPGRFKVSSSDMDFKLNPDLKGAYQLKNIAGVLQTCTVLRAKGFTIPDSAIAAGINTSASLTGLKGRWQKISDKPLVICDVGHNAEGIAEVLNQIKLTPHKKLHWVFGVVKDKSPEKVLGILPQDASYYFCQAKIPRAMDAKKLAELASQFGLSGKVVPDVNHAIQLAKQASNSDDLIIVGGSTFVVAEVNEI